MRDPLLLPLVSLASGIVLAGQVDVRPSELAFLGASFATLSLLCLLHGARRLRAACLLLTVAVAGMWLAIARRPRAPDMPFIPGAVQTVTGCVASPVSGAADRPWFYLEVAPGARVRVSYTPGRKVAQPDIQYGRRVSTPLLIRTPLGFRNPGSFDYAAYLAVRDVFWQGRIPNGSQVTLLNGVCGDAFHAAIYRLREGALTRLDRLYADRPFDRGMMKGLLFGDSSEIRRVWVDDFRRTGTYHALVISGSHISFVAGLFILWLRWFRYGEGWVLTLACAVAWLYALVAGADPPVVRSAAGFTLAIGAKFLYRRVRLVNIIAAVAIGFLAVEPWQLYEASFQLSFLAVGAIAAIAVPLIDATSSVLRSALRELTGRARPKPIEQREAAALRVELILLAETIALRMRASTQNARRAVQFVCLAFASVWDLFVVSAAVQLALVLPMVAYFHRLSLSGLSANIVATPLITAAIPFGFAAVLGNMPWAAGAAAWLLEISRRIVAWHAAWEPAWRVPDPPLALAALFAAGLLLMCLTLRFLHRGWFLASALATCGCVAVIVLWRFPVAATPGALEISAIDVGQGDSLLLTLPDGRAVLMDTGGLPNFSGSTTTRNDPPRLDIGEDVVAPYLWSRRFRRIDVIALSHLHHDHAGGAPALIENFRPRELWIGTLPDSQLWKTIAASAARAGTVIRQWRAGETEILAGVRFEALTPLPTLEYATRDANEDSLTLAVSFRRHRFFLSGDIDRRTERGILESGRIGVIDVLKVAHHGSRRASHPLILDAMRPAIAVISSGAGNTFNHPHTDVVEELRRRHSMILRTDTDGLVTIRSDGRYLSIDTMRRSGTAMLQDPF